MFYNLPYASITFHWVLCLVFLNLVLRCLILSYLIFLIFYLPAGFWCWDDFKYPRGYPHVRQRGQHPHGSTPCATEPDPSTTFPQKSLWWLLNSTSLRKSSTIIRKLTTGSGSCLSHAHGRPWSCCSPLVKACHKQIDFTIRHAHYR